MADEATVPCSILVVEDEADSAESLAAMLRIYGHAVRIASCATDAYHEVLNDPPDVVLLDIGLPGMNGWELAAWLKTVSKPPDLIAITAKGQPDDYQRSTEAGILFHLVKPVDPNILIDLLKRYAKVVPRQNPSDSPK